MPFETGKEQTINNNSKCDILSKNWQMVGWNLLSAFVVLDKSTDKWLHSILRAFIKPQN